MSLLKKNWTTLLFGVAMVVVASPVMGHELWVEAPVAGKVGEALNAHLCWGHFDEKAGGEVIASLGDRLFARLAGPEGPGEPVALTKGADSFIARFTASRPGYHALGGKAEVGILDQELHGIPARTRIVMYGKSLIHVEGSEDGLAKPLGMELELIPTGNWKSLRPGEVVTVKVQFKGKPIGGRKVVVSLKTIGNTRLPKDARVDGLLWTVEDHADPRTGEVSFPLIVAGQHLFQIKYTDETPGRYEGDCEVATKISHMRKGDTFTRTLHNATLTLNVKPE